MKEKYRDHSKDIIERNIRNFYESYLRNCNGDAICKTLYTLALGELRNDVIRVQKILLSVPDFKSVIRQLNRQRESGNRSYLWESCRLIVSLALVGYNLPNIVSLLGILRRYCSHPRHAPTHVDDKKEQNYGDKRGVLREFLRSQREDSNGHRLKGQRALRYMDGPFELYKLHNEVYVGPIREKNNAFFILRTQHIMHSKYPREDPLWDGLLVPKQKNRMTKERLLEKGATRLEQAYVSDMLIQ